ncbi:hypothetical protein L218DRAFT_1039964 [Marasmius fiardii PR-910]|nr:hypothetical protein L218DRAFT_1039964 [Marasmius fiardii PR-910]
MFKRLFAPSISRSSRHIFNSPSRRRLILQRDFTHHTYTLSNNIEIFFSDSGPPPDSKDYTTLVILHGAAFNGYSELEDLKQGRKAFMERIGLQVGEFLEQYIEAEKIPEAASDRKAGGIAIMGCSMGNASAMALFSNPDLAPPETYRRLKPYVKDLVFYEPPYQCFAYSLPSNVELYKPTPDPNTSSPALNQNFKYWVSSFFDHGNLDSANLRDMDTRTKNSSDATINKWTPKEVQKFFNREATVRSELPMFVEPMQSTLKELSHRVFYDKGLVKSYFPDLKLTMIVGTKTNWMCAWGSLETQRRNDERLAEGATARPMKTYKILGGNHYVTFIWSANAQMQMRRDGDAVGEERRLVPVDRTFDGM